MAAPSILGRFVLGESRLGVASVGPVPARPVTRHGDNRPKLPVTQDAERVRQAQQPTRLLPERDGVL